MKTTITETFRAGMKAACEQYAVWQNGERFIGSPEKNLKDVFKTIDELDIIQTVDNQIVITNQ
jgi:hypothetical protein